MSKQHGVSKPKIICFQVMPGLEPEFYTPLLEQGLDAIVIQAVPTGGVPAEGRFSFIPFIRKATELKIPVYLVRSSTVAAKRPKHEYEAYRRNMNAIYIPEKEAIRAAIVAGATPLEKPDINMLTEIVARITEVYSNKPSYEEGIGEVGIAFNSSKFMESIKRIRGL